jgi:hypothetical protein
MIHKQDGSSFESKWSFDWSAAMREIDGLSLTLVDFYVPALTPQRH